MKIAGMNESKRLAWHRINQQYGRLKAAERRRVLAALESAERAVDLASAASDPDLECDACGCAASAREALSDFGGGNLCIRYIELRNVVLMGMEIPLWPFAGALVAVVLAICAWAAFRALSADIVDEL